MPRPPAAAALRRSGRERSAGRWLHPGAAALALAAACAGWLPPAPVQAAPVCEDDGQRSVRGAQECLVVHVQGHPAPDGRTVLLVFIHGDNSGGGPSDPYIERGARFAGEGTVVVTLIRPGYFDRQGRTSTGVSHRFTGDGYPPEVVDAVGDALARLRQHYQARRLVVAGVSGGAAITGVLLGRAPGLIDLAVLSGCPCNVQRWRELRGSGNWRRSLSPHRFVQQVPPNAHVRVVTGDLDTNTPPVLGQDYARALQQAGVADAQFVLAVGADHPQAGRGPVFFQTIDALVQQAHAQLSAKG